MIPEDKIDKELPEIEEPAAIKIEEYVEIISTEDDRIKIIGEELANDTGRAIFRRLSQGAASPSDLSNSLGFSLPLVNWHINRLLSVGLIRVERVGQSSKNRGVKYYGSAKTVLVIISAKQQNLANNRRIDFSSILERFKRNTLTVVSFVSGTLSAYLTMNNFGGMKIDDSNSDPTVVISYWTNLEMLLISLAAGAGIAGAVYLGKRLIKGREIMRLNRSDS